MRVVSESKRSVQVGQKFGRAVVIGIPFHCGSNSAQTVVCECSCGVVFARVVGGMLRSGDATSCGYCIKHGGTGTRLFNIWRGMKDRCYSKSCNIFKNYGARGISVCKEWHAFPAFRDWALANGYTDSLTIEREDVNGNYGPGNCRWATMMEQGRNRRNNLYITAFGENKKLSEWFDDARCGIDSPNFRTRRRIIYERLRNGWNPEDAIATPQSKTIRDPKTGRIVSVRASHG